MGDLSSELATHADRLSPRPRIYADANVPVGLVAYMRTRLHWDVLHVLEREAVAVRIEMDAGRDAAVVGIHHHQCRIARHEEAPRG